MLKIFADENMHIIFSRDSQVPLKYPPLQFNCLCVYNYLTATKSEPVGVTSKGKSLKKILYQEVVEEQSQLTGSQP